MLSKIRKAHLYQSKSPFDAHFASTSDHFVDAAFGCVPVSVAQLAAAEAADILVRSGKKNFPHIWSFLCALPVVSTLCSFLLTFAVFFLCKGYQAITNMGFRPLQVDKTNTHAYPSSQRLHLSTSCMRNGGLDCECTKSTSSGVN